MTKDEQHQIPVEEFDLLSDWLALEPGPFQQQLQKLRTHPRITTNRTRQALDITIQALEALHKKR